MEQCFAFGLDVAVLTFAFWLCWRGDVAGLLRRLGDLTAAKAESLFRLSATPPRDTRVPQEEERVPWAAKTGYEAMMEGMAEPAEPLDVPFEPIEGEEDISARA